jgi:rubrerythrin
MVKDSKDIENIRLAIQKKEHAIERYSEQVKALCDPEINALLEGILHNEIRHKGELDDQLDRLLL